ncbi:enoyl-CoA hydratase/isomerase family protein [Streptomyces sp. M10(2022)]
MPLRTETDKETRVALVTLDRPEKLNAIDLATATELVAAWRAYRFDDEVRAIVVTGRGPAPSVPGSTGVEVPQPSSPYTVDDPLSAVGPKANDLWKPVIAAVEGMACGGAFYLIGEAEFVVASERATFFDPHTTYGMVSAYEAISMAQRMPFGEVARMSLMGTAERVTARRAYETGWSASSRRPAARSPRRPGPPRSSPRTRRPRCRAPYGRCGRRRRRPGRRHWPMLHS